MEKRCAPDGRTPELVIWLNGAQLPCLASSYGRRVEIDAKGNPVEIDLTLLIRKELLLTADTTLITADSELVRADNETPTPVSGKKVTFRGLKLKIVSVKISGPQSHFVVMVKDESSA